MKRPAFLALVALVLSASGCAARMRVEPALAGAEAYPVTGASPRSWGAPLAFGPWRATGVADGTTFGWSFELLGVGGLAGSRRPFTFLLSGPAGALEAECLQRSLEVLAPFGVRIDADGAQGRPVLACAFRPAGATDTAAAWTLALSATGQPAPAFEGQLRDGRGVAFTVRSVHALQGSALPMGSPAGFTLGRGAGLAAAVETIDAGRVLLQRRESESFALAAAAAALLLFQPAE